MVKKQRKHQRVSKKNCYICLSILFNQKNKIMKKIFLSLSLLTFLASCTKVAVEPTTAPSSSMYERGGSDPLIEDQDFQSFLKNHYELSTRISPEEIDLLRRMLEDDTISDDELPQWLGIFDWRDSREASEFFATQERLLQSVNDTYGFDHLSEGEKMGVLTDTYVHLFEGKLAPILSGPGGGGSSDCRRKWINCLANVTAGSVLGNLACIPLDATFFLGIACHSAVLVAQATQSNICHDEYEDCLNK
jgi:hypothetical protein